MNFVNDPHFPPNKGPIWGASVALASLRIIRSPNSIVFGLDSKKL